MQPPDRRNISLANVIRISGSAVSKGIGSAILPLSKVAAGTGARIATHKGQADVVMIAYQALWLRRRGHGPATAAFGRCLAEVASEILRGMT